LVVPHGWEPHAVVSETGTQPLQLPALHVPPSAQFPQATLASQLSFRLPQRFWQ
jgi:hypothetical protein